MHSSRSLPPLAAERRGRPSTENRWASGNRFAPGDASWRQQASPARGLEASAQAPARPPFSARSAQPTPNWTRRGAANFFYDKNVRELLGSWASELALWQPDDPGRFIYERLKKEYAVNDDADLSQTQDDPAQGEGGDGLGEIEASGAAPEQINSLRIHLECRHRGTVRRSTFVRRAPARTGPRTRLGLPERRAQDARQYLRQFQAWKDEALKEAEAFIDEAVGLEPSNARAAVTPPAEASATATVSVSVQERPDVSADTEPRSDGNAALAVLKDPVPSEEENRARAAPARGSSSAVARGPQPTPSWRRAAMDRLEDSAQLRHRVAAEQVVLKWSTLRLGGRSFKEVIETADADRTGTLSRNEFDQALEDSDIKLEAGDTDRVFDLLSCDGTISVEDVEKHVRHATYKRQVSTELSSIPVHDMLASNLLQSIEPGMDPFDWLLALDEPTLEGLSRTFASHVQHSLLLFLENLEQEHGMHLQGAHDSKSGNQSKFAWTEFDGAGRAAQFADIEFFRKGLNELIGLPAPKIRQGMEQEHCSGDACDRKFKTSNYGSETTPKLEWEFVVNPDPDKTYPHEKTESNPHGRDRRLLSQLMQCDEITSGSVITEEEVIALRLYTGPMFMFYNSVLRGLLSRERNKRPGDEEEDIEVKYKTTIHMISSGIVKLAEILARSAVGSRKIYRGMSGMMLPDCFFKGDKLGWKGGVEIAFMSCTRDRDVALQYLGKGKMPVIFEIEVSQVDRGASLQWLSQYPGEAEVLLPPLSNLEVTQDPKILMHKGKAVLVFPMQLNVNLKIMKREELEHSRKSQHMASVRNTCLELTRDLVVECEQVRAAQKQFKHMESDDASKQQKDYDTAVLVSKHIMREVDELVRKQDSRDTSFYNNDRNYKTALEEVALLKEMALGKFMWWRNTAHFTLHNIDQLSMLQVMKVNDAAHYKNYDKIKQKFLFKSYDQDDDYELPESQFRGFLANVRPELKGDKLPEIVEKSIKRLWDEIAIRRDGHSYITSQEFVQLQYVRVDPLDGALSLPSDSEKGKASPNSLGYPLKQAALKCIEAYVDEDNLDSGYGIDDDTALIAAASQGDLTECEVYLDAGCDMTIANRKGYTAISSAACQGMDDILALLIVAAKDRGLDTKKLVEHRTIGREETPLILASAYGWEDCVKILLDEGADVSAASAAGFTAFISAAEFGMLSVMRMLEGELLGSGDDSKKRIRHARKLRPHNPFLANGQVLPDTAQEAVATSHNTFGLRWRNIGATRPPGGRDLAKNPKLSEALVGLIGEAGPKGPMDVTFTQKDWDALDIHELSSQDFFKVGTHYFRPADTSFIFQQTRGGGGGGGWTAMHLAARNGHLDIVQVLCCVC